MPTRTESGRRATRPLVVATLCAALLGFAPATAHAQTLTDPDTAGDMARFTDNDTVVPAPNRRLNDVTSTRLTHGARRVAIRVDVADLRRVGDIQALLVPMVTNEGVRLDLQLVAHRGHWTGETYLVDGGGHGEVPCRGVRHKIDYRGNVMRASLPRRCVSNPRWVKFRVVSLAQARRFYVDDALSDDPVTSQDDNDLTWSGRVRRQPSR